MNPYCKASSFNSYLLNTFCGLADKGGNIPGSHELTTICKQYVNQKVAGWQCKKKTKYDGVKESLEGCLKLGGQGRPSPRRWHLTVSPGRCWVTGVSDPELLLVTGGTGLACLRGGVKGTRGCLGPEALRGNIISGLRGWGKMCGSYARERVGKKEPS